MQKLQADNQIISQFVETPVKEAMERLFSSDGSATPIDAAMVMADLFGGSSSFRSVLEAKEKSEAETKLISSFHNNLNLLVVKTWVEKDDETQKEQLLFRLDSVCKALAENTDYVSSYVEIVTLLHDAVTLLFGSQTKQKDFMEYAFRIDPGFGIFWWYIESLPDDIPAPEAARIYLLLGMLFLSNY
ncbi:MAG: hypothetical protein KBT02_02160 [Treponema sp.]|nr:hypothetical protein [Candidatus Treponema caballi]